MNTQERMNDTRVFRIAVIAVAAVAVLAIAAYLFGAGLRADTSASAAKAALPVVAADPRSDYVASSNASAGVAKAASLAALEKSRADFHADQSNSARAAAPAVAADSYQNTWMGFTSPESVGAKLSVGAGSAADPSTWIKPEGIRPAAAGGADQLQWIKPEGIKASGAK